MKRRLQELWDEVVPVKGDSPQPEAKAVLARMEVSMEDKPRRGRRGGKLVVILAAVLVLTVTAVSAGSGLPGYYDVLSLFQDSEASEYARSLVTELPVSISDENYTFTITSSIADRNNVYLVFQVEVKTEQGRERLAAEFKKEWPEFFSCKPSLHHHVGASYENYDPGSDFWQGDLSIGLNFWNRRGLSIRFNSMEEGCWLKLPIHPISDITLRPDAEAPGQGYLLHAAGGPVKVKKVVLSPLSVSVDYTTPRAESGEPILYFLWQDGSIDTMGRLLIPSPANGEGSGGDETMHVSYSWQFWKVQDITKLKALIFGDMAYPLDGGEPYPMDMSGMPRSFHIPLGDVQEGSADHSVPFFALCGGLGIPYTWDAERGTASAQYRGVTVTVQTGEGTIQAEGAEAVKMNAAPVYQDGELWIDAASYIQGYWGLTMLSAYENKCLDIKEEGLAYWVVRP